MLDHKKIYDQIIDRAKIRGLDKKKLEGYYERHHVKPKCLGGGNEKENLVLLTAREHFICHRLLTKIHPDNRNIIYAFWMMYAVKSRVQNRSYNKSSRVYQQLRSKLSELNLGNSYGKGRFVSEAERLAMSIRGKGKKRSLESRQRISIAQQNRKDRRSHEELLQLKANKPKRAPSKRREWLAEANRARVWTPEMREKARLSHLNQIFTTEQRLKISEAGKGRKHSEETKARIAETNRITWIERRKRNVRL